MIPVNEPVIAKNALKYVTECLYTGWISSKGKFIEEFEKKFAHYLGVKHAITTTSGTTALHLALASLGIGKGDEVILPAHTMIACAFAVVYTGAKPVLIDAERDTWNMNVNLIEEKINEVINKKILGKEPKFSGLSFWTDGAILKEANIPTVIFGPSGEGLHSSVEYVNFKSVVYTTRVLIETIIDFCNL